MERATRGYPLASERATSCHWGGGAAPAGPGAGALPAALGPRIFSRTSEQGLEGTDLSLTGGGYAAVPVGSAELTQTFLLIQQLEYITPASRLAQIRLSSRAISRNLAQFPATTLLTACRMKVHTNAYSESSDVAQSLPLRTRSTLASRTKHGSRGWPHKHMQSTREVISTHV